jgi:hypothetical protein
VSAKAQRYLLGCPRLLVAYDVDTEGDKGAERPGQLSPRMHRMQPRVGEDMTALWQTGGGCGTGCSSNWRGLGAVPPGRARSPTLRARIRTPAVLQPLRNHTFGLLWAGQTISLIGDFVYVVALPFQVLALGGNAVQLGAVAACSSVTQLLLLLVGGALVDRLPRQRVILVSDLTSGIILGLVAALGVAGALRIEYLYGAAALRGAALAFFTPAMGAIVPELVPSELLAAGNALRGLTRQAALVLGPALGGVLAASVGPAPAIAVDALSFFVSFGLLCAAPRTGVSRRNSAQPATAVRVLDDIHSGLAFTLSLPWLWVTIFGFALINLADNGAIVVALPLLVHDARVYGGLAAALGAGEGLASVVIAQVRPRRIGLLMYVGQAVAGLGLIGVALGGERLAVGLGGAVVLGAGLGTFGVLWLTALQREVPGHLLARVTSVDYFGALLLGPVGPFVIGAAVQAFGPAPVIAGAGVATAALCLAALLVPSIRGL